MSEIIFFILASKPCTYDVPNHVKLKYLSKLKKKT